MHAENIGDCSNRIYIILINNIVCKSLLKNLTIPKPWRLLAIGKTHRADYQGYLICFNVSVSI